MDNINFICGMSRAGTTWMVKAINCHPDCVSFGETLFYGRRFKSPKNGIKFSVDESLERYSGLVNEKVGPFDGGVGSLRYETKEKIENSLLDFDPNKFDTNKKIFQFYCDVIKYSENKKVVFEKTPHHLNYVNEILNDFPRSRVIGLFREPYGFSRSYKNQGLQSAKSVRELHERLYHPVQVALVWRGYARRILLLRGLSSDRFLEVEQSEIIDEPFNTVNRVMAFCNCSPLPKTVELPSKENSSSAIHGSSNLSDADIFWLWLLARREIKLLGYAVRNPKIFSVEVFLSIVSLPVWLIRTLYVLRNKFNGGFLSYAKNWLQ